MSILMTFINLFFVPFIALSIHCHRFRIRKTLNVSLFLTYAVYTVCDILFTHLFLYPVNRFYGIEIANDTSKYMAAASVAAVLMPYLVEIFTKLFHISLEIDSINTKKPRD